jgi:hypothetical protein
MSIVAADANSAYTTKMAAADSGVGLGNAEDVTDFIINISPEETPLLTALPKKKATAVTHEWLTDDLAAAATNERAEGTLFSTKTIAARSRVSNPTQISYHVYEVTGSMEAINKYGVSSELSYQAVKAMKELKRDMDLDLWQNTSSNADSADITGVRTLEGMHAIVPTAHTGDASYLVAALTGTAAEATFNAVLNDIFDDGPSSNIAYMRPSIKRNISRWTGVATKNFDQEEMKIVTVIDTYQSDFGTVRLVIDRYMEAPTTEGNDQLVVGNWDNAAVAFLRPFQTKRLPSVKDALSGVVLTEYTLEYGNVNSYGRMKSSTG